MVLVFFLETKWFLLGPKIRMSNTNYINDNNYRLNAFDWLIVSVVYCTCLVCVQRRETRAGRRRLRDRRAGVAGVASVSESVTRFLQVGGWGGRGSSRGANGKGG